MKLDRGVKHNKCRGIFVLVLVLRRNSLEWKNTFKLKTRDLETNIRRNITITILMPVSVSHREVLCHCIQLLQHNKN